MFSSVPSLSRTEKLQKKVKCKRKRNRELRKENNKLRMQLAVLEERYGVHGGVNRLAKAVKRKGE